MIDCLEPFDLSDSQAEIAVAPYGSRQLILAGPGTGKTHLVAARLAHLIASQRLKPASQVLLLSYTRTAVREMKERLAWAADIIGTPVLKAANVRTMDSFAYRLHLVAQKEYPGGGYDRGIESATSLIRKDAEAMEYLGEIQHIIVDEAQDLLTYRDSFIRELLKAGGGGFTVLADPRQAIYDYLLFDEHFSDQDVARDSGFWKFKEWLDRQHDNLVTRHMRESFRHRGNAKRVLNAADEIFDNESIMWPQKYFRLGELTSGSGSVPQVGGPLPQDELPDYLFQLNGRTAVLARTNGEVFAISRFLDAEDVPHHIVLGSANAYIPGWVGRILPALPREFNEDDVIDAWDDRIGDLPGMINNGSDAYGVLQRAAGGSIQRKISKNKIVEAIRNPRRFPAEGTYECCIDSDITLSTIHRAKGREFDNVVIITPQEESPESDEEGFALESRILYVALSRPKKNLKASDFMFDGFKFKSESPCIDRWCGRVKVWWKKYIEIRPDDFNPYSLRIQHQEDLWNHFGKEGGYITAQSDHPPWAWELYQDHRYVGRLRNSTKKEIATMSKRLWKGKYAKRIESIFVENLATVPYRNDYYRKELDPGLLERGFTLMPIIRGYGLMIKRY